MSYMTNFATLEPSQQRGAHLALEALDSAVNAVTGTLAAAVAQTAHGYYSGANLWLSGPTHLCAEIGAITAASSANDRQIGALYLAQRRVDGREPNLLTPCGACGQLVFDLAVFTGQPVTIFSVTDKLDLVQVTPHVELLPHAFASQRLRDAGRAPTERTEPVNH